MSSLTELSIKRNTNVMTITCAAEILCKFSGGRPLRSKPQTEADEAHLRTPWMNTNAQNYKSERSRPQSGFPSIADQKRAQKTATSSMAGLQRKKASPRREPPVSLHGHFSSVNRMHCHLHPGAFCLQYPSNSINMHTNIIKQTIAKCKIVLLA